LELLEKTLSKTSALSENIQRNEHIVSCSILRSAIASILLFEGQYLKAKLEASGTEENHSTLSYGGNNMREKESSITSNFSSFSKQKNSNNVRSTSDITVTPLMKCYEELRSACNGSSDILVGPYKIIAWMVVDNHELININALFSQCTKVLGDICSRSKPYYFTKNSSNPDEVCKYWKGRHQQAQHISLSNNALRLLLEKIHIDDSYVKQEVSFFQKSVEHLVESLLQNQFPSKEKILQIYSSSTTKFNPYIIPDFNQDQFLREPNTEPEHHTPRKVGATENNNKNNKTSNKSSSSWFS